MVNNGWITYTSCFIFFIVEQTAASVFFPEILVVSEDSGMVELCATLTFTSGTAIGNTIIIALTISGKSVSIVLLYTTKASIIIRFCYEYHRL